MFGVMPKDRALTMTVRRLVWVHAHRKLASEGVYPRKDCIFVIMFLHQEMQKIIFTGTNYDEVKRLCGDKVLAPYFCMGFSMLSVDTGEGFVSVNEGDTIVREDDGSLRIEK